LSRTQKIGTGFWAGFGVVILIVILLGGWHLLYLANIAGPPPWVPPTTPTGTAAPPTTEAPVEKQIVKTLPVYFKLTYKWAGTTITSDTACKFLDPATGVPKETVLHDDNDGRHESGAYTSKTELVVDYNDASNTKYQWKFTVPYAYTEEDTYFWKEWQVAKIGTYAIYVRDPSGNAFTSGSSVYYYVSSAYPSFTVEIRNSYDGPASSGANGSGFSGTFTDVQSGRTCEMGVIIRILGSGGTASPKCTVSTLDLFTSNAENRYYYIKLADDALDRIKNADGTYKQFGSYSLSFNMDNSGQTASTTETLYIYLYVYFSQAYFKSTQSLNSEGYSAASFSFSLTRA